MFRELADEAKQYYLRIPDDDLLVGFEKRSGRQAVGHELGGWYSQDVFSVFGQVLSGLARLYAATADEACRTKAKALLARWGSCLAKDGYFYYSDKPNAPHYVYDKLVGGLVDMAEYCGDKSALAYLSTITEWAEKHLDRSNLYAFNFVSGPTEWYTLSENLYRAYRLTGDQKYKDFARVWEYKDYWRLYAVHKSIFGKRSDGGQTTAYHAYSHVNSLGGAALAYEVTGDAWYLETLKQAYSFLRANECFATGGYGPNETLAPKDQIERLLTETTNTFETQCGSWAVFKLCKHLIALTGDAQYGNWVEELAYNGVGATIPMTSAGQVMYYSDYNPAGGVKKNCPDGWSCCTGTRPMAVADVTDLVYFHSPNGLFVNLFVPSKARLRLRGVQADVVQQTRFPDVPGTSLKVTVSRPVRFTIGLRAPSWLTEQPTATVNGRSVPLTKSGSNWLCVTRVWRRGDELKVNLPMEPRSVPFTTGRPYPTAIAVGPVVLAFRSDAGNPALKLNLGKLRSELEPVSGSSLTYRLRQDPAVVGRPFYDYKEGEEYFLYLDPAYAGVLSYRRLETHGLWRDSGQFWYSNEIGATCEGSFDGDSLRVLGGRYDDGGRAEVRVDGKVVGTFDQYGPGRPLPFEWHVSGLGVSHHRVRITVLPDKDPASTDHYINVAGLKVGCRLSD